MSDLPLLEAPHQPEMLEAQESSRADEPLQFGSGDYRQIPLDQIIPDPFQPRRHFDETGIEGLAQSIRAYGQLHPILVYWDQGRQKFVIISGERRYRACLRLGRTAIEAKVVKDPTEQNSGRLTQLAENICREELLPSELARAFESQLQSQGWSNSELAARLQISPSRVTKIMAVRSLSASLQTAVDEGRLPLTVAYEVSRLPDAADRNELAELVLQGRKNRTEIVAEVQSRLGKRKSAVKTRRVVFPLGKGASVTISTGEELDWERLLEGLGQLTNLAKKARTQGNLSIEELERLCGDKSNGKKQSKTPTSSAEGDTNSA